MKNHVYTFLILLMAFNAFALAPSSKVEQVLSDVQDVLFLQESIEGASHKVNEFFQSEVITEAFLFGSPLIFQENGIIFMNQFNDFDIVLFLNRQLSKSNMESAIRQKFQEEIGKNPVFSQKKLDLIPRFITRAVFNYSFSSYLNQSLEKQRQNQVMIDAKWVECNTPEKDRKFIKRYLEQVFYREGASEKFLNLREAFQNAESEQAVLAIKARIFSELNSGQSLGSTFAFKNPMDIFDRILQQRAAVSSGNLSVTPKICSVSS